MSTPTLTQLIKGAIESRLLDVRTALIGKVLSFDAGQQTVDVQPVLKKSDRAANAQLEHQDFPTIPGVPVLFPRTRSFFIAFPIEKGDYVQVLFNEESISEWWAKMNTANPARAIS